MRTLAIILIILCVLSTALNAQTTIRVPQDQPTIQAGINAASNGDTVLVAEGTYTENIKINKKIVLTSLYITDWDTSHISKTIIDGSSPSHPDSGSTVVFFGGTDTTTLIKGFTIRGGKGNRYYWQPDNNYGVSGGGIRVDSAGARISKNYIVDNALARVDTTLDWTEGGGISVYGWQSIVPVIIDSNLICGNTTDRRAYGESGGIGAFVLSGRIVANTICHNSSTSWAGGIGFGNVHGPVPSVGFLISDNVITDNSSLYGGGVGFSWWSGTQYATLQNNVIARNTAQQSGGGINAVQVPLNLINNTIAHNIALVAPGMFVRGGETRMLNNIFWNPNPLNSAIMEFDTLRTASQFFWWYAASNLIRGGVFGSIDADPLFNDTISYSLSNRSPAIGAGRDSTTLGGILLQSPSFDYVGLPRPRPSGSISDLGAIESDLATNVQRVAGIPREFLLDQNFPNPFNPKTVISYQLSVISRVTLRIFDVLGREVAVLVNEEQPAGVYQAEWDARVSSGVYFYRLQATGVDGQMFVSTKKMILLR